MNESRDVAAARRVLLPVAVAAAILGACAAPVDPAATSLPATVAPSPVATPSARPPDPGSPPSATIIGPDGPAVPGSLGSYVWAGVGSDAPWLPGAPVVVPIGAPLEVRLPPDVAVASWSALIAPGDDATGSHARSAGEGAGPIRIEAGPPRPATLAVTVRFAGDRGDATYYWHLTAP